MTHRRRFTESMCLGITPVIVRCLLGPPKHVWPMDGIFTAMASPNSPNGGFNRIRLPTLPHRLPQPPIARPPL